MNTNRNHTALTRIRTSLRAAWNDQVRAQRALMRVDPYGDWIRRDHR